MTSSENTYSSTQYSILEFSIDNEFEIKLRIVKGWCNCIVHKPLDNL